MSKLLTIYVKQDYCSIKVQNGVTREAAGPTVNEVVGAMHDEDRQALMEFCKAVLDQNKAIGKGV